MPVLSSSLFTAEGIDGKTRQRLEDCAEGGNESMTHIAHGQSGEHVRRVQLALARIKDANPGLGIPAFAVTGKYDQQFARAVLVYKSKRDIRNFRNQVDDIVGRKTIIQMDTDLGRKLSPVDPSDVVPPPEPPPPPPPFSRRILHREFIDTKAELSQGAPDPTKDLPELLNILKGKISPDSVLGSEDSKARRVVSIPSSHRVNHFTMNVEITLEAVSNGTVTITTTTLDYEWGSALPNVLITTRSQAEIFGEVKPQSKVNSTQSLPRDQAEAAPLVVPPSP